MNPKAEHRLRALLHPYRFFERNDNMRGLIAICSAFFLVTAVLAQNRIFLSKAEVQQLATGKKWVHVRTADQRKIQWDIRSDGNLYGSGFVGPNRDNGTWMVNDQGQLCVKWRGNSVDRCVAVAKDGDKLVMVDSNDSAGIYAELSLE
jgi:hypothetical protein